ncbi:hypothetical protein U9M48_002588 [Paspalum notatum var. saurae]|uniref:Uncharacterized protein n=1 Tax=Paspalum notatum var. saurae TaxID=547442 RepID=A0AAQ3PJP8_PASNO
MLPNAASKSSEQQQQSASNKAPTTRSRSTTPSGSQVFDPPDDQQYYQKPYYQQEGCGNAHHLCMDEDLSSTSSMQHFHLHDAAMQPPTLSAATPTPTALTRTLSVPTSTSTSRPQRCRLVWRRRGIVEPPKWCMRTSSRSWYPTSSRDSLHGSRCPGRGRCTRTLAGLRRRQLSFDSIVHTADGARRSPTLVCESFLEGTAALSEPQVPHPTRSTRTRWHMPTLHRGARRSPRGPAAARRTWSIATVVSAAVQRVMREFG